ncbi:MAG TPA: thiamine pyrophosphate-dependent enzyme [Candidatus Angelobacter sp.]|nr:thiamine pyrophosphate-dependent enzyme [Candidatus Angelobacter sp.]
MATESQDRPGAQNHPGAKTSGVHQENDVNAANSTKADAPIRNASVLDAARLKEIYSTILRCRMLEKRARSFHKPSAFSVGNGATKQEAAEVGCCMNLEPADVVLASQRDFIANFVKGAPLKKLFPSKVSGKGSKKTSQAPSESRKPFMIQSTAVQLSIAAGAALALSTLDKRNVTLAFWSEGDGLQSLTWEALKLSADHRLPVIYVVRPGANPRFLSKELRGKAPEIGLPIILVDGNDTVAIYRVSQEAVRRARDGHGPTVIECKVLDSPHAATDPLAFMENYLKRKNLWSDSWRDRLIAGFSRELDRVWKS